jgi:hypothetical protein
MAGTSDTTVTDTETAVLVADGLGGYYVVPAAMLGQHRLSDAQVEAIRKRAYELEVTGEVTGYSVGGLTTFLQFGNPGGNRAIAGAPAARTPPGYGLDRPQFPCPPKCQWISNLSICWNLLGGPC